jgi:ubiquinone/menaquinone biosynthesis C-methylase UbiE
VLTSSDSLHCRVSSVLPVGGIAEALPALLEAYRTGGGVHDADFGVDWRAGHADANRALFAHVLPGWLRSVAPDLHRRLAEPGARLADIACGAGWAAIALARSYPALRVDGYDIDRELVSAARENAESAELADRVTFEVRDCARRPPERQVIVACLFDTLHELPRPVEVLAGCRGILLPRGAVLVMDARVADRFAPPGDEIERFQYTTSLLHCLPACMAEQPSAETGTVMRRAAVQELARQAGFARTLSLPSRDPFHSLYRLIP